MATSKAYKDGRAIYKDPKWAERAMRHKSYWERESCFRKYAVEIAENVNVPIILVGMNRNLELMNDILNKSLYKCRCCKYNMLFIENIVYSY